MELLKAATEWLKCLAHPYRLRMNEILFNGEYTVDEIANLCGLAQPATLVTPVSWTVGTAASCKVSAGVARSITRPGRLS